MKEIIVKNEEVVVEFFHGDVSGHYWNGMCYRLYWDRDDNTFSISIESSSNTWLQRDDNSLVCLWTIEGYETRSEDELFTEDCSIYDFGYSEFLEQLEEKMEEVDEI